MVSCNFGSRVFPYSNRDRKIGLMVLKARERTRVKTSCFPALQGALLLSFLWCLHMSEAPCTFAVVPVSLFIIYMNFVLTAIS